MAGRDDDALSWGGDDDPTLDVGAARDADGLPAGYTAVGWGSAGEKAKATGPAPSAPAAAPGSTSATAAAPSAPASTTGAATAGSDTDAQPTGPGNASLVGFGVIGGVYLLLAIGWLIGGLRLQGIAGYLVAIDGVAPPVWAAGTLAAVWLAVLAPLIWFVTVIVTTRRSRVWLRWLLLIAGILLLLPWPFIMVGTVGA